MLLRGRIRLYLYYLDLFLFAFLPWKILNTHNRGLHRNLWLDVWLGLLYGLFLISYFSRFFGRKVIFVFNQRLAFYLFLRLLLSSLFWLFAIVCLCSFEWRSYDTCQLFWSLLSCLLFRLALRIQSPQLYTFMPLNIYLIEFLHWSREQFNICKSVGNQRF